MLSLGPGIAYCYSILSEARVALVGIRTAFWKSVSPYNPTNQIGKTFRDLSSVIPLSRVQEHIYAIKTGIRNFTLRYYADQARAPFWKPMLRLCPDRASYHKARIAAWNVLRRCSPDPAILPKFTTAFLKALSRCYPEHRRIRKKKTVLWKYVLRYSPDQNSTHRIKTRVTLLCHLVQAKLLSIKTASWGSAGQYWPSKSRIYACFRAIKTGFLKAVLPYYPDGDRWTSNFVSVPQTREERGPQAR